MFQMFPKNQVYPPARGRTNTSHHHPYMCFCVNDVRAQTKLIHLYFVSIR